MEREDLIRELAEKLITANMEKEDIFNEYDKILQSTVFHQGEEKPKKSDSKQHSHSESAQVELEKEEGGSRPGGREVEGA